MQRATCAALFIHARGFEPAQNVRAFTGAIAQRAVLQECDAQSPHLRVLYAAYVMDTAVLNHGKRTMYRLLLAIAACHQPLNVTSWIH